MKKKPKKKPGAKKMGRPPLPDGQVRGRWLKVRISQEEESALSRAASRERRTIAHYVRKTLGL